MMMLVTYDLDRLHSDVKDAAKICGFRDYIISNAGEKVPLPNTTLLIDAASPEAALDRFVAIVRSVSSSIIIERSASFDWGNATMHTDRKGLSALAALFEDRPLSLLETYSR